jgi:hypothetical protein
LRVVGAVARAAEDGEEDGDQDGDDSDDDEEFDESESVARGALGALTREKRGVHRDAPPEG